MSQIIQNLHGIAKHYVSSNDVRWWDFLIESMKAWSFSLVSTLQFCLLQEMSLNHRGF